MPDTIDGALVALMNADDGITDIVKGIGPFTNTVPKARPFITYYRITTDRPKSNDGPTGQAQVHYQIDCYADDLLTAKAAANAVRLAVDGYAGSFQGWHIDYVFVTNEQDSISEPIPPGQALPVQRVTMDITLSITEPIPERN
jgi:hypothetical protein